MTATVVSCNPGENGHFIVRLDATLFHPNGGGQPSDTGHIEDVKVLEVIQYTDDILHVTDRAIDLGDHIAQIDLERRMLHTRMHSAGHLIAVAGETMGWKAIKANHRPGEGRIVFEPADEHIGMVDLQMLSSTVNCFVALSLPRHQTVEYGIRTVCWGDLPAYACGGTHVASTDRVGNIIITALKLKKRQLSATYEVW